MNDGIKNLGEVESPGKLLSEKTQTIARGGALRFSVRENQVRGLGDVTVTPKDGATIERRVLEAPPKGQQGGVSHVEYTVRPGADAARVTIHCAGQFQVRQSPDWAFEFTLEISKS